MSDPSSVSGDFDFNHILTSQISRVEILKGNQSSVYGSGAIKGTINIHNKKVSQVDKKISWLTLDHTKLLIILEVIQGQTMIKIFI